jgi:hypothetical protein
MTEMETVKPGGKPGFIINSLSTAALSGSARSV